MNELKGNAMMGRKLVFSLFFCALLLGLGLALCVERGESVQIPEQFVEPDPKPKPKPPKPAKPRPQKQRSSEDGDSGSSSSSGGRELGSVVTTSNSSRFTKYSSGVFVDSLTGLEWYPSPNHDYTWDMAKSWVSGLKAAGGGWRMPTRSELAGLKTDKFRSVQKTGKCTQRNSAGECMKTEYDGGTGTFDCYRPGVVDWTLVCGAVWSNEIRDSSSAWLFTFYYGKEYWSNRGDSDVERAFAVRSR